MKRKLLGLGLLALVAMPLMHGDDDTTSHTFYSVRPLFKTGMPERDALWRIPKMDARDCGLGGSIEVVGMYSQSTNSKDLGKFFFPYSKHCLNVQEFKIPVTDSEETTGSPNSDITEPDKNVDATHFNVVTSSTTSTYTGSICICPEQKVGGIGFGWRQVLWRDCETDCPKFWMEVTFPVLHVSNKMRFSENVINDGGGAAEGVTGLSGAPVVGNMTDAFKQSAMLYGKIDNKKCLSKWGVADVEVKLGWGTLWGECCKLNGYVGFVAPTGNKVDKKAAAYVFSPIIGNNHHWGFLIGNYADIDIWERCDHDVRLVYTLESRILFKNNQWRSFDLIDKQWGRYMAVYANQAEAQNAFDTASATSGSFGINSFTQCLEVAPRYELTSTAAFQWYHCRWSGEVGYNFFARHKENVSLCKWTESVALKAVDGVGQTQQARTITKNFRGSNVALGNYDNVVIRKTDLDLDSAAHPGVLSNIIYGALGFTWDWCDIPNTLSAGGSYEFTSVNAAINRWAVWGKWDISF